MDDRHSESVGVTRDLVAGLLNRTQPDYENTVHRRTSTRDLGGRGIQKHVCGAGEPRLDEFSEMKRLTAIRSVEECG